LLLEDQDIITIATLTTAVIIIAMKNTIVIMMKGLNRIITGEMIQQTIIIK